MGLAVAGCASTPPTVDVTGRAAFATGTSDAITFQIRGEPLDAREWPQLFLSIPEAVRRTLAHDPRIQAALARVRSAEAETKQARLLPNPVLSVILRLPEGGGSTEIEAGLAADLISLLSRPGRVSAADDRLRAAAAEALSVVLDVLAEVRQRYAAVQTLDAALVVLQERIGIVDRLLELARSRLRVGEGTRLDVLTLESQRVELDAELADRELERRHERLALARLIGQPSGDIGWSVQPWAPDRHASLPESRWVELALENRPEVQARRYELAALGAERSLARFALFGGGGGVPVGPYAVREGGEWAIGPAGSAPVPLFDLGQARRDRARAAVIEARHQLTDVRRQVIQETRQAHAAFAASQANLQRVGNELVPLLERRLAQAEAQFKAGQTDVTALLMAEQDLRAGRTRLVELQRRTTEALIRLQRAVGGPGAAATLESTEATAPPTQPAATRPAP
jgi:cobalt-zinc-cadmium efflux system outer membrane protein